MTLAQLYERLKPLLEEEGMGHVRVSAYFKVYDEDGNEAYQDSEWIDEVQTKYDEVKLICR